MFMSIHASHPASDPARDAHRARVAEHMAALKELSDLAVELAKALGRQAIVAAQAGGEVAEAAEKSFSRATRTVRLTAALDVRLSKSLLDENETGEDGEQAWWMRPDALAGAAQRLRDKLKPWMVPEPGSAGEDQDGEGREREARERLVETEGDGVSLGAAWLGRPEGSTSATHQNSSPSMGEGQGWGCSHQGSGEGSDWAPEPSASSPSPTGDPPPSQPFPHRGGRALLAQPKAVGGGSPGAQTSQLDPQPKARAP